MNSLKEGWFSEVDEDLWPGQCFSIRCDELLHQSKSKYQDLIAFKNNNLGNVLVLDDKIQCVEFDEFAYQEMIAFLPLNSHPNPENVLIIGGGDGGVAREVVKHPLVKRVTQCEIDEEVIRVSKLYLPNMARGFDSDKMTLYIGDGLEYLRNNKDRYDVIITDSSDPKGPAECLFGESYYQLLFECLRPNGIVCCQGENLWLFGKLVKGILEFAKNIFPSVGYAYTQIPSYPCGLIGFVLCSRETNKVFDEPIHVFDEDTLNKFELKYYNKEIHKASYALPTSFRNGLGGQLIWTFVQNNLQLSRKLKDVVVKKQIEPIFLNNYAFFWKILDYSGQKVSRTIVQISCPDQLSTKSLRPESAEHVNSFLLKLLRGDNKQ